MSAVAKRTIPRLKYKAFDYIIPFAKVSRSLAYEISPVIEIDFVD